MMNDVLRDLRFSVRMLVKNPMFTFAAVTTLALGIGLNAATFSAVHNILLRPLPGTEDPEELVQIYREWPGIEFGSVSIPHYQDLRDRTSDVFESVGLWYFEPISLSSDGRSERTMAMVVSANFFQTYGVRTSLGRPFIRVWKTEIRAHTRSPSSATASGSPASVGIPAFSGRP